MKKVRYEINAEFIASRDSFAIIEPVWWSVSIYDGPERYSQDLLAFSKEQRLVLACHWYLAEVNNGGHDQFYSNSTGIVWQDAIVGFSEVGLPEISELITASAERMGGQPSLDRDERHALMEARELDFDDLDRELYRLDGQLEMEGALVQYIRSRPEAFYFSGAVAQP